VGDGRESFLSRWSRRKLRWRTGRTDSHRSVPSPSRAAAEPAPPRPDAEDAHGQLQAPRVATTSFAETHIDAVEHEPQLARALRPEVPLDVRRRALRQLWASDPIFSAPDGLQDYAGDYTDKALALPSALLATAYKIGRGFASDGTDAGPGRPEAPKTEPSCERSEDSRKDTQTQRRDEAGNGIPTDKPAAV
jgi:hypothetical protein